MKFITLGKLMDILQSYKDNFGEDIPVLLSDKNSPDSLTNLIGAYVIDIMDPKTDESGGHPAVQYGGRRVDERSGIRFQ